MERNNRVISYIYICLILSGVLSGTSEDRVYIITCIYFCIFFVLSLKKRVIINKKVFLIPFIFAFTWLYGLIIGYANLNEPRLIIRTFAGMVTYFMIIPLYNARLSKKTVGNMILVISVIVEVMTIVAYIDVVKLNFGITRLIPVINSYVGRGGFGDGFIQYNARRIVYIGYAFSMYEMCYKGRIILKHLVNVLLILFDIYAFFDSEADILVIIILTVSVLLVTFKQRNMITKFIMFVSALIVVGIVIFMGKTFMDLFFSANDLGNKLRYYQIQYIIDNLNLWGHGLGSQIEINYDGVIRKGYGIEVIYLNLIYKFGIIALPIFICYGLTVIKAFKLMCKAKENTYDVIPYASMGYLITALGNPVLFSQISILLHCLCLLSIFKEDTVYDLNNNISDFIINNFSKSFKSGTEI